MQMIVNYPEKLPDALQQSSEQFEHEAKMAMAVKLYELKRISSGTAAAIVGMERVEFLLSLHHYGVVVIDLSAEELQADFDNA
jgi:predicted HTH domain antitoxin